jgi:transposase
MLTRQEDYAHQQPSLTALKRRRLEVAAGAPTRMGKPSGVWAMRQAEKQLAQQAEASYKRSIADRRATSPNKKAAGASVTAERA